MSILELSLAKSQVRITQTAEDVLLQGYLDAAEAHCARFLNRNLYPDQATLDAAVAAVAATLQPAQDAFDTAFDTWTEALATWEPSVQNLGYDASAGVTEGPGIAYSLPWQKAQRDYSEAQEAALMTYYGVVINAPITQAILLTFAHFSNNREAVLTDAAKAVELPMGVEALLGPYRVREGV